MQSDHSNRIRNDEDDDDDDNDEALNFAFHFLSY